MEFLGHFGIGLLPTSDIRTIPLKLEFQTIESELGFLENASCLAQIEGRV